MANNEINDLTAKTTPVSTDEVEIQETAGGLSKKATVGNLAKGMSYNDLNDKPSIPAARTDEEIADVVGGMVTFSNTETNITVTYQDADNTLDFVVPNSSATTRGAVELATTAETTTATDTERAVTPAGIGAERSATATLTNKTLSTGSTIDANVTVTEVLKKVYPVGSIYINRTVSTNPATLLGFGTWTAITDKMIMGRGGTYSADGGAATHTHTLSGGYALVAVTEPAGNVLTQNVNVSSWSYDKRAGATTSATDGTTTLASALGGSTDSGSTIPPMIVAYIWERTA